MSKIIKINLVDVEKNVGEEQTTYGVFTIHKVGYALSDIELYSVDDNGSIKVKENLIQELKRQFGSGDTLVAIVNCNNFEHYNILCNVILNLFDNNIVQCFKKYSSNNKNTIILDLSNTHKNCDHFDVINERIVFLADRNGICSKCGDIITMPKEYFDALETDSIMKSFTHYINHNKHYDTYMPNPFTYPSYQPNQFMYQPNPFAMTQYSGNADQLYTSQNSKQKEIKQEKSPKQKEIKQEKSPKQETIKKCSCEKCSPKDNKIEFAKFSDLLEKIKSVEKFNISSIFDISDKESSENILIDIDEMSKIFNSVIENIYGDNFPSTEEFRKNIKNIDNEFKKAIIESIKNRK